MDKKSKIEINQLWFVAKYYFEQASQIKESLKSSHPDWLNKTPEALADQITNQSSIEGKIRQLTLMGAHLASCAMRLCTIDEKMGSSNGKARTRWSAYASLRGKENLTTDCIDRDVKGKRIMHLIFRQVPAHPEDSVASHRHRGDTALRTYYLNLSFQNIYENLKLSLDAVENSVKPYLGLAIF